MTNSSGHSCALAQSSLPRIYKTLEYHCHYQTAMLLEVLTRSTDSSDRSRNTTRLSVLGPHGLSNHISRRILKQRRTSRHSTFFTKTSYEVRFLFAYYCSQARCFEIDESQTDPSKGGDENIQRAAARASSTN